MSELLNVLENEVQIAALSFLLIVYVLRIVWLYRFTSRKERTYPVGNAKVGIGYSLLNVAMPWSMESTRKNLFLYIQFLLFHLGIAAAISATFIIPYWPILLKIKAILWSFQMIVAAAFFAGLLRLSRRLANPVMRSISSPDDYFSLTLLILYLAVAFMAMPNNYQKSEWPLILFFALTAFFLVYVPFSKIGHYLYYPFTRFFLGRTLGHRGVYAKKKENRVINRT
jgi:nitrate reductase gamma subunit